MLQETGKKIIILYILQILRKYTDAGHTMTQQQIADRLRSEYGLEVNRATVKRNLFDLIEAGYDIQYTEVTRSHVNKKTGEKEENTIYTDLYYEHDFTESELHMLIDGLLFSRSVPYKQRKTLIDKLGKLSSAYFNQRMNHVHCMSADSPQNPELFHTIDILDEAITEGKQIRITYNYYGTDMKLHPGLNPDGTVRRQTLNPYQMVATEGRYYLICNNDHYNTVSNYRIDRITDIELLDTSVKPRNLVEGLEDGLNLQDYVYQNLNMFSGKAEKVEFLIPKKAVSLVIDFFGKHVSFHDLEDGSVSCRLQVSTEAMKHWAVEHANMVRVVSPESLAEEVREELRKAAALYGMAGEIRGESGFRIAAGLSHTAIRTRNIEDSIRYYTEVLGLREAFRMYREDGSLGTVYMYFAPGQYLELFSGGSREGTAGPDVVGFCHICVMTRNIRQSYEAVKNAGGPLDSEIKRGKSQCWMFWTHDPDGTQIEVMEMPPESLQAQADRRLSPL